MYLTFRVTGRLVWAILLHATTDPATFLQVEHSVEGVLTSVANQSNWPVIILGLTLVWFVRGRAGRRENESVTPSVDAR